MLASEEPAEGRKTRSGRRRRRRLLPFRYTSSRSMGNKASGKGKKDPTVLSDEDLRVLKVNTQYSEEEIQAWHSGFLKDCPSGKLDKKQFLNVYKVRFKLVQSSRSSTFVFTRNSIPKARRTNIATLFSKHSIPTITTGLTSLNFCKTSATFFLLRSLISSPPSSLSAD